MQPTKVHMHPDLDLKLGRPGQLELVDPERFTMTGVVRKVPAPEEILDPQHPDYPFEADSNEASLHGDAEDKEKKPHPERFRKLTPRLRGQSGDRLANMEFELRWQGDPQGRGPHFKVFP